MKTRDALETRTREILERVEGESQALLDANTRTRDPDSMMVLGFAFAYSAVAVLRVIGVSDDRIRAIFDVALKNVTAVPATTRKVGNA